MRENGKDQKIQLYAAIMNWISTESEILLDIYNSVEDITDKLTYMARISELGMARDAIIDIFTEGENNG